jgi:predicted Zn-dependent protease
MIVDREEAFRILDRAFSFSIADEAEVSLQGGRRGSLRFARNEPTSSGLVDHVTAVITAVFGSRSGTVSTTQLDDESLRAAVRRAEEMARVAPENPEYVPRLGPQQYGETPAWDEATAARGPEDRARVAGDAIALARANGLIAAGYLEDNDDWDAYGTSRGLRAYHRATLSKYSTTSRSASGASGWAGLAARRAGEIDGSAITRRAVEKALRSSDPVELPAKPYTAILEPSAAAELVGGMMWSLDRRAADENRSAFAGVAIGQKLLSDRVTIVSDPQDARAPGRPWDREGRPAERTVWFEDGALKTMHASRYWAESHGVPDVPQPANVIMSGGAGTLDDLVASTDYGLLVTSFWYIRHLEQKTLLLTGLTRDGLFLVENGRVTRPVVNFRWNDSPIRILQNVEALSEAVLATGRGMGAPYIVPAWKVRDFQFASISPSS